MRERERERERDRETHRERERDRQRERERERERREREIGRIRRWFGWLGAENDSKGSGWMKKSKKTLKIRESLPFWLASAQRSQIKLSEYKKYNYFSLRDQRPRSGECSARKRFAIKEK
jgi:hypothetical protein